ncbi:MAG: hypothetical protein O3A88_03685 [Proteobacteria bacterium]|nr:hypothetical protein [Pseudomonadota bacterium]
MSARAVTAGAAAAVLALLCALGALALWQSYSQALSIAELRAQSAAHVISAHVTWLVEANNQLLHRVDEALGDQPYLKGAMNARAIDVALADAPGRVAILIVDADGEI